RTWGIRSTEIRSAEIGPPRFAPRGFAPRGFAQLTNCGRAERIEELFSRRCGPVAQLGARFHGMEEVVGSIPTRSTNNVKHLAPPPFRDLVASLSQIPK